MTSKLLTRILSSIVLAPVFLAFILYGDWPFLIFLGAAFGISVAEWYSLSRKTNFFAQCFSLGLIYMTLSYCSFFALREAYSLNVILVFIAMIWASDIGAYFTGKTLGGPKLIQKISPNKTWTGFGGAMFFPALVGMVWIWSFGLHAEFSRHGFFVMTPVSIILGLVLGSVGQAGDLAISFVKRKAQVKDTGTLIPGHGGLLDRIDSMLLGAPVFLLILTLMSYVL